MILKECNTETVMREFTKFLKEENVFDLYYRNLENTGWTAVGVDDYKRYIRGAFEWSHTSEGHIFWEELSKKWSSKLIGEYKKKNKLLDLI